MNTYYRILNEIAAAFDMDQWDEQVNPFTDVINEQLNVFVHNTKYAWIFILEHWVSHNFPQFDFYRERIYINGKKFWKLDTYGAIENKWKDRETVNVIIEDLDQLGESCENMFYGCYSLVSVPWFDTSGVKNMAHMFESCGSLETVPKFDTSRVIDMYNMFYRCKSLSEVTKQKLGSVYDFETDNMK